jgi:hypothetical protein
VLSEAQQVLTHQLQQQVRAPGGLSTRVRLCESQVHNHRRSCCCLGCSQRCCSWTTPILLDPK